MKKIYVYAIVAIAVIVGAGSLLMGGSGPSTTGNAVGVAQNGDVQEVVIGMKNYNYHPNTITVKAGQPVKVSLDDSVYGCYRDFTIRDLGVRKYLAKSSDSVEFTIEEPGTYTFACSMGMGTGKIIAE